MPIILVFLACGCGFSPYRHAPRYALPETRSTAARHLIEALAFGGADYSEVTGDELTLRWRQRRELTDRRVVWLRRELRLLEVTNVERPERPGELWQLAVDAAGGRVTFHFHQGEDAAKAEAALRRLRQPLTEAERKALAGRGEPGVG